MFRVFILCLIILASPVLAHRGIRAPAVPTAGVPGAHTHPVSELSDLVVTDPVTLAGGDTLGYDTWYDVRLDDATGDGVTDDRANINTANTNASGKTLYFSPLTAGVAVYRVSSNITLSENIVIEKGASLSIDVGVVVTFSGQLRAGLYQIFSGLGTVTLAQTSTRETVPQWWGALADDSNDDTTAIQASFDAAPYVTFLPRGTYKITAPLTLSGTHGKRIVGSGRGAASVIKVYGGVNGIEITGTRHKLENLRLLPTTNAGTGVEINAGDGTIIDSCHIGSDGGAEVGFAIGVDILSTANYTKVTNCYLRDNDDGIHMDNGGAGNGPNACMIQNNVIFGGNYSIRNILGTDLMVMGNSFEGYATCGMLITDITPMVSHNHFESAGVVPIELASGVEEARILSNTYSANTDLAFVTDNSGSDFNEFRPAKMLFGFPAQSSAMADNYGGSIEQSWDGADLTALKMEATKGDLQLEATTEDDVVSVLSEARFRDSIESVYGGLGEKAENLIPYSEEMDNVAWTKITTTVAADDAVGPDGRTTAEKLTPTGGAGSNITQILNGGSNIATGDVITCRVWLKGDSARPTQIRISGPGGVGVLALLNLTLTTTWELYEITATTAAAPNTYFFLIYSDQTAGTGFVHAWGAHVIVGTSNDPMPYIKTNAYVIQVDSPALVAADGLVVGGDSALYGKITIGPGAKHDGFIILPAAEVQTVDATANVTLDTLTLEDENGYLVTAKVIARQSDGTTGIYYITVGAERVSAGSAALVGSVVSLNTAENEATWDCTFTVSGNNLLLSVTGEGGTTIEWGGTMSYINMSD